VQPVARRAPLDRSPQERALAWLYTGPLGQLWGVGADIVEIWVRWQLAKRRQRSRATTKRS
jgi:hypothetical protein